ncbi:MAG: hypothetical protein KBB91_01825 [Candidatus Pacebacteria bacterium]|jgi:purine-cytosine permease-like protein|nr:hypothetical protein [Candidatus Paceibacterota bacterium]MBP9701310.1 hypothetical protein [Candidatus Paceibacterota bacterium]
MITFIKNKIDTAGFHDINKTLKSIALYSWVSVSVLFVGYLYFVGAITFSVIKERGLQEDTKTLVSRMGQEELAYLSSQKNLSAQYAQSAGFITADFVSFAPSQKAFAWNVGR